MGPSISLLHATYFRTDGPVPVRDAWLEAAADSDSVEYVVAMDEDDLEALDATVGLNRVVSPPTPTVSAVRNWNAAAARSSGDLLVVIADDLFPPSRWDEQLQRVIAGRDLRRERFAVKVQDGREGDDTLLRHPVISRAYYENFGLFHDSFSGICCDNDATLTGYWRAYILDGRSIRLDHRHPTFGHEAPLTPSQSRMNASDQITAGRRALVGRWPSWRRQAAVELVPAGSSERRVLVRRRLREPALIAGFLYRGATGRVRRRFS